MMASLPEPRTIVCPAVLKNQGSSTEALRHAVPHAVVPQLLLPVLAAPIPASTIALRTVADAAACITKATFAKAPSVPTVEVLLSEPPLSLGTASITFGEVLACFEKLESLDLTDCSCAEEILEDYSRVFLQGNRQHFCCQRDDRPQASAPHVAERAPPTALLNEQTTPLQGPILTELNVSKCTISALVLRRVFQATRHLRHLHCGVPGPVLAAADAFALIPLRELHLQSTLTVALEPLLRHIPGLLSLHLIQCDEMTEDGAQCLVDHVPNLTSLTIAMRSSTVNVGAFRFLSRLRLKHFDMMACWSISADALDALLAEPTDASISETSRSTRQALSSFPSSTTSGADANHVDNCMQTAERLHQMKEDDRSATTVAPQPSQDRFVRPLETLSLTTSQGAERGLVVLSPSRLPCLKVFSLSRSTAQLDPDAVAALGRLTTLENLDLSTCSFDAPMDVGRAFQNLRCLQRLNLSFGPGHASMLVGLSPSLRELNVVNRSEISGDALADLQGRLPHLHALCFGGEEALTTEGVNKTLKHCAHLTDLSFSNASPHAAPIDATSLESIGNMRHLTKLSLHVGKINALNGECDSVSFGAVLPSVRTLHCGYSVGHSVNDVLRSATQCFPNLEVLNAHSCILHRQTIVEVATRLRCLKSLDLSRCRATDSACVGLMADNMSMLESLNLSYLPRIDDACVTDHITRMASLRFVDLSGCALVTSSLARECLRFVPTFCMS